MPKLNLDNNEVVMGSYVFSNRVLNPFTGNNFSKDAYKLARANRSNLYRKEDSIDNTTKRLMDERITNLAFTQEALATLAGLRPNRQNISMQTGGSIYPTPTPLNRLKQQYTYIPQPNLFPVGIPQIQYATTDVSSSRALQNTGPMIVNRSTTPIASGRKLPSTSSLVDPTYGPLTLKEVEIVGKRTQKPTAVQTKTTPGSKPKTATTNPASTSNKTAVKPFSLPDETPPSLEELTSVNIPVQTFSFQEPIAPPPHPGNPGHNPAATATTAAPASSLADNRVRTNLTEGDLLQAITVGSQFLQLLGGPDEVAPVLDESPVEQASFDPRRQLYRSARNQALAARNLNVRSASVRNALLQGLAARHANLDSDILSQYDSLNTNARQTYLDKIGQRSRFNAQVRNTVNQYNLASRDAHRMALSNAFHSLGNFGIALNEKKNTKQQLELLKAIYPDVFSRLNIQ